MSQPKLKVEMWSVDRLIPYDKNAKIHTEAQIESLAKVIKTQGWDVPIVVDKDGVIIKGHGRRLTLMGIVLGVIGALVVTRLMQQALFEVDAADPLIHMAVAATLLLVTECASWFPARRATRSDPVRALRSE